MRRALTLTLAALLAACASKPPAPPPAAVDTDAVRRAEFEKDLQRWHGAELKELLAKMGQPTSTRRIADGRLTYVYAKSRPMTGPTGAYTFKCTVGYVLDDKQRVNGHWFEGC